MGIKSIENVDFRGKRVLIRVDYNVPLNQNQEITDDTRIRESLPTIQRIINQGGSVILMSHLGRPKGHDINYSMMPVAIHLSQLLNKNVIFDRELFSPRTKEVIHNLDFGTIVLLENLRYYKQETAGDEEFAKQLSELADIYVNDAFGSAHRAHCSTTTVAKYFPGNKYCGYLLENELKNLEKILRAEKHPFTAIIGGAKVSSKIDVIKSLSNIVDNMIIGGGMAFTFVKALGGKVGSSLIEEDKLDVANEIVAEMMRKGVNLCLPTDAIIADAFSNDAQTGWSEADNIPDGWMGLDIGQKSIKRFADIINHSETILWNGPLGVFEMEKFKQGTKSMAISTASATIRGAYSLVGGGDSVAAINKYNLADQVSYVSTGGGAMLEYLEGKELPAVKALEE
ncbi:MAG: phosphoglycerate kinase [Bacteroidetes bacterium GWF2_43_63]|nr:MAG: phosphoglycerate kinase [Bacteroidetes bacterium GWE2_42_42]OFY54453.1 MAG: phosphoglycerate kinase [Bacteroidetes bacterium GWF2_43_63]HBG70401.1 phosphoglycerate kinase [Bacteroidales bacterium]HCB63482.1 phosphoglycerate kinase [Bacteroidales bacterium]